MLSGKVSLDQIEEISADVGGDVVVKWWVEPYDVSFSVYQTTRRRSTLGYARAPSRSDSQITNRCSTTNDTRIAHLSP